MKIETLGHASLFITDDEGKPVLLTDPWLIGSCYWRSWWLQNYVDEGKLSFLKGVKYCYITHEHPDHFHTASIKKLGDNPTYLSPDLPQEQIANFLSGQGFTAEVVPLKAWKKIHEKVEILSIPLYNDDSVLVIVTPKAVIVNFNDAKPSPSQVKDIRKFIEQYQENKKVILLSSYSPASIVNSFIKGGKRLSMKEKKDYVDFICKNCKLLEADFYMPFASQVIFYRSDSAWANEYKVQYDDLKEHWSCSTQLLPPFTSLDIDDFTHKSVEEQDYRPVEGSAKSKVEQQEERDRVAEFTTGDEEKLRKKLASNRLFFAFLFPKGIGFKVDDREFVYKPWSNSVVSGEAPNPGFTLMIPTQALKDVLSFGHFGDLGITMFTLIQLNRNINPKMIYLFFILITLHDYGHTQSWGNFIRWLKQIFSIQSWKIPQPSIR